MWQFSNKPVIDRESLYRVGYQISKFGAIWTGEVRCPKAGEHYLVIDNGLVKAYEAFDDKVSAYHIARIYKLEKHEYYELKEPV